MIDEIWLYYFDFKIKRGFCIWEYLGFLVLKKVMVLKSKENFLLISIR